ncbi:inner membrane protein [Ligilactobacillus sp. WC1T17]|uniref:Inner membrane protein n=1 Tax=Ligilactobacillus ruminis TaxID=1623 RepID=A0ABY1AD41_9LACO|nr:inner membrane protein [Ligilactobacillus ruminis]
MQYKTHLVTSFTVGFPMLVATGNLNVPNLLAYGVGVLLPDIDHPTSFMGQKNKALSKTISKTLGHRGGTHSLFCAAIVYALCLWIRNLYFTKAVYVAPFWLLLGYLAHLLEDSFSKEGINWFWPLSKNKFKAGGHFAYYRTGKISEYILLGFFTCILLGEIYLWYLGRLTFTQGFGKIFALFCRKMITFLCP